MAMGRGKRGDFAKKKKKRNCGFPGVFNMREMRKTRETKVTRDGETVASKTDLWTRSWGRRACSKLGKWL